MIYQNLHLNKLTLQCAIQLKEPLYRTVLFFYLVKKLVKYP